MVVALVKHFAPAPDPIAKEKSKPAATTERIVHIDGYDPATNDIINPLSVWENYETRKFAFQINHGTEVMLVKRTPDGQGVYIRDKNGREGWITYWFIKELK